MALNPAAVPVDTDISPLENEYHKIRRISDDSVVGLRTLFRVNSKELGVLYPAQYRIVTNRNALCIRLATLSFKKALKSCIQRYLVPAGGFVSVYFPVKMLLRGELYKLFASVPENQRDFLSSVVPEFSSDILIADADAVVKELGKLKDTFGMRFMLSEYGDSYCPVLRLNGLPFDFVVLDRLLNDEASISSASTFAAVKLANQLSVSCVLEPTDDRALIGTAAVYGCSLYCDASYETDGVVSAYE